jgi:crotonobetainyl-CoA:carnitine CoA-transferase CaiB-like acyl-CoA transferase
VTRALDGITILDFTRHMAGPFATVVLSDHGARVIKIEGLPEGDPTRHMGVGGRVRGESGTFLMWNRGKESLALDLRRPEGIEIVHRLAEQADVVIENYRPGVADDIGIGFEELRGRNPRLVYCSLSAFGSAGPLAPFPGTDPVVQAMSGIMAVTGEPDAGGMLIGVPVADFTGAMCAVQGILLALLARERTGTGQKVDVSMLFGMLSMLSTRLAWFWTTGEDPRPNGSAHSSLVPYQRFFTADGSAVAGTWGGESWPRFCEAIERPDLEADPRFGTNEDRRANKDALIEILSAVFATRTTAEWERRFRAVGGLFAPVLSIEQVINHPHVAEAGLVQSAEHAGIGTIPQLGPVIDLSETRAAISGPPPLLGQHTRQVLRDGGYTDADIDALVESGVAREAVRPAGESARQAAP